MASLVIPSEVRVHRQITTAIALGASLHALLSSIARAAAHLCHAPMAAIALLTDGKDELEVVGTFGIRTSVLGARLPVRLSFNGLVITAGRAVRSTDVLRDPPPMVCILPPMTGARGVLAVPLRDGSGPFGTLSVAKRVCWRFSAHHEALLAQLADSASIAIQNARLREQLHSAGRHSTRLDAAVRSVDVTPPSLQHPSELDQPLAHSDSCHLSPREREILKLVANGKTFKEIAAILGISGRTVEHYLERLKLRFHQQRLAALVGYMLTHGVVLLPPLG